MTENEVFIHESVDGVGKTTNMVNMNPVGSMLNVESVQWQSNNLSSKNDDDKLATKEIDAQQWKPHNRTSICWGFYAINNNMPIDLENPHMLHCIIC